MIITGSYPLLASPDAVHARFFDETFWRDSLPYCRQITKVAHGRYRLWLALPIGPLTGDSYLTVHIDAGNQPHSYDIYLHSSGSIGELNGRVQVELSPNGQQSTLHYQSEWHVVGTAVVPPRLLQSSANALVRQCLEGMAAQWQPRPLAQPADEAESTIPRWAQKIAIGSGLLMAIYVLLRWQRHYFVRV